MKRLAIITLLSLAGCNGAGRGSLPAAGGNGLLPERGAVLPDTGSAPGPMRCSRSSVESYWTPSPEQVRELEAGLTPLLRAKLRSGDQYARQLAGRLDSYYRQYAGIVVAGRKLICVNGVTESSIRHGSANPGDTVPWRRQPVMVLGGGASVFRVEYDPATREFSNFSFNGSA